jgi:hypothetical protein
MDGKQGENNGKFKSQRKKSRLNKDFRSQIVSLNPKGQNRSQFWIRELIRVS